MVYSGSLGLSRINLETLQSILITLKNKLPELKGIAISEEPKQLFIDLFRRANFKENDYLISNSKEISIDKILSSEILEFMLFLFNLILKLGLEQK